MGTSGLALARRSVAALAVVVLSASAAVAQSPSASTGSVPCPPEGTKVGYSPITMQFEWFTFVANGLKDEAAKCGVEVLVYDPNGDAQDQVSGVESMLTSGISAIAISAVDGNAIKVAVDEAHAQGIPVVQHVSSVPGADANVGVPESEFGRQIGLAGGKWLVGAKPEGPYEVAILNADSLGEGLLDRKAGLLAGLEESVPAGSYEVVADTEAYAEDTALDAATIILEANPDLDLFLTVNDVGALGALAAIEAAGLDPATQVGAVGSLTRRGLEAVVAGKMPGGTAVPGAPHGEALARTMFALIAGQQPEFDQFVNPSLVLTKEEAQEWLESGGL
jgi:ribose transport system substrate-binding protein